MDLGPWKERKAWEDTTGPSGGDGYRRWDQVYPPLGRRSSRWWWVIGVLFLLSQCKL